MSDTKTENISVRTREGVVIKNAMDKTVVVEVSRRVPHPKYSKFVKRRMRYKAHDPENTCNVGDVVLLVETRPLSKTKRWRVQSVKQKAIEA